MLVELNHKGIKFESESPLPVEYKGELVGNYFADIIVEGSVIVELKSVRKIDLAHEIQLVNYLTTTDIETGLILNFSEGGLQIKRKVKSLKNLKESIPKLWQALKYNQAQ